MKWSLRIAKVAGIDVYVHATFSLLILWVALSYWQQSHSVAETFVGIAFTLALFLCVVLHEFGHALTARKYGIKTRDITLLPIGGLARLERMPDDPREELWVALAGPAVNVVIAGFLSIALYLTGGFQPLRDLTITAGSFIERLILVNIILVVFNLIPAFPMDGGRVLRALLATRMPYARATNIAAACGQGIALLFGFLGFFGNPMLVFIALFVWIGASQEASMVQIKTGLEGVPVRRAMLTEFRTLAPTDTLARAVELIIIGSQHDFPVVDDGNILGLATRKDLMIGLAHHGRTAPISEIMTKEYQSLDANEPLTNALARMQETDCQTAPVVENGRIVGMMTMENIGEFMMIRSALDEARSRHLS